MFGPPVIIERRLIERERASVGERMYRAAEYKDDRLIW
jgi:hypothetical protein